MSGLDKILQEIENQSRQRSELLEKEADRKADTIRAEGERASEEKYNALVQKYRDECEREYANACSAADSAMGRELLMCKVECIDNAVKNALEYVSSLPDKEYFAIILKLVVKHLQQGNGILSFGARDLARLPDDFAEKVNNFTENGKTTITISDRPADIENGFLLSYGKISENCSFSAIAEAERNTIRDKAAAVLFEE